MTLENGTPKKAKLTWCLAQNEGMDLFPVGGVPQLKVLGYLSGVPIMSIVSWGLNWGRVLWGKNHTQSLFIAAMAHTTGLLFRSLTEVTIINRPNNLPYTLVMVPLRP